MKFFTTEDMTLDFFVSCKKEGCEKYSSVLIENCFKRGLKVFALCIYS